MRPAGGTAFDCPKIANCVFQHKLQAYLKMLMSGSAWGPKTFETNNDGVQTWKYGVTKDGESSEFLIHVIEFQAQGLPDRTNSH